MRLPSGDHAARSPNPVNRVMPGGGFFSGSPPFFVCPKPGGGRKNAITIRTQKQIGFVGGCNPSIRHSSFFLRVIRKLNSLPIGQAARSPHAWRTKHPVASAYGE